MKRNIIRSSKKVVVLCDYLKFYSPAFISVCPLSDVDAIVTNKEIDPAIADELKKMNIEVILV